MPGPEDFVRLELDLDNLAADLMSHFGGGDNDIMAMNEPKGSTRGASATGSPTELSPSPTHLFPSDERASLDVAKDIQGEIEQLRELGVIDNNWHQAPNSPPTMRKRLSELNSPLLMAASVADWSRDIPEDLGVELDSAQQYLERAKAHFKAGRYTEAIGDGLQSTAMDPSFEAGFTWTAAASVKLGDFAMAEDQFAFCQLKTELDLTQLQKDVTEGTAAHQRGDMAECVRLLRAPVHAATHALPLKRVFVSACVAVGDWPSIAGCMRKYMNSPPFKSDVHFLYNCVVALYNVALFSDCLHTLTENPAIINMYKDLEPMRKKCSKFNDFEIEINGLIEHKHCGEALSLIDDILANHVVKEPQTIAQYFHFVRARALDAAATPDLQEVVNECTTALEGNECLWTVKALRLRAGCYERMKESALALEDFERILEVDPRHSEAMNCAKRLVETIPDLYAILGVMPTATTRVISNTYRHLMLRYHPDKHQNQTDEDRRRMKVKFHEIYEAYMLLSDPAKRADYDEFVRGDDLDPAPSSARRRYTKRQYRQMMRRRFMTCTVASLVVAGLGAELYWIRQGGWIRGAVRSGLRQLANATYSCSGLGFRLVLGEDTAHHHSSGHK